jgi:hypothetical protein
VCISKRKNKRVIKEYPIYTYEKKREKKKKNVEEIKYNNNNK